MNATLLAAVFLFVASPGGLAAQEANSKETLTSMRIEGKGLFKQRCALCHTSMIVGLVDGAPVMLTTDTYGPVLSKDILSGPEAAVRELIRRGSERMPGFQYGLKPAQIDAIIEYLRTLERTAQKGSSGARANPD